MSRERLRTLVSLSLPHGRTGRRLRRALAAALVLAAAAIAIVNSTAPEHPGIPTVVATHAIASGESVERGDLRVVRFPRRLRPAGATGSPDDVAGHVVSGAVAAGAPITARSLLDGAEHHPGRSNVPVRLADPAVAALLEPGTTVDVITMGNDGGQGRELAADVTVLTVTDDPAAAGTTVAAGNDNGPLVILAVPDEDATRLAAATLRQPITVTLSS